MKTEKENYAIAEQNSNRRRLRELRHQPYIAVSRADHSATLMMSYRQQNLKSP
jgi:hypothetical protein